MIKIDFEKFDEKGLKPILKALEKEGVSPVSEIQATNKTKRESGFQIKTAVIVFESGQKLSFKIKAGGAIFQVKLNNTVLAIKNADDMDKAVKEVAEFVMKNEAAYQKQKEKQAGRVKIPKAQPVNTSVAAQIEKAGASLTQLSDANTALTEDMAATGTIVKDMETEAQTLGDELKAETAKTEALTAELNRLREAA